MTKEELAEAAIEDLQNRTKSALHLLSKRPAKPLRCSGTPWVVGIPIIVGLVLTGVAYLDILESKFLMAMGSLVIVFGILFMAYWSSIRERRIQKTIYLVQEARVELQSIKDHLEEYIIQVNNRASRHFNTVTHTKVTAYFYLYQIKNALEDRLAVISSFLRMETNESLISTYKCFQQPLQFGLSVTRAQEAQSTVPLHELKPYIAALIIKLEDGIAEIEASLKRARRQGVATEEEDEL